MSKPNARYSSIRSLSDLRRARRKLRVMRMVNESYIAGDFEELKYRMSPSNLLEEAKTRFLSSGMFGGIVAGFRAIAGLRDLFRR